MIPVIHAVQKYLPPVSLVILLFFLHPGCSDGSLREERFWSRTYGAGGIYSVQDIGNAGDAFVITGHVSRTGKRGGDDIFAALIGTRGNMIWNRRYGPGRSGRGYSLQAIPSGFLIGGMQDSAGDTGRDALVLRLDGDGDVVWSRVIGGYRDDWVRVIRPDMNTFIAVGSTSSFGRMAQSIWVLLLDLGGKVVWDKTFGDGTHNTGVDVVVEKDGYVIAGNSLRGETGDVAVFKIDRSGKILWERILGGRGFNYAEAMTAARDGYVIAGYASRLPESDRDAWILRIDSRGNPLWSRTYGGKGDDALYSLQVAGDGFIVSGTTNSWSAGGSHEAWLFEVDAAGHVIWSRTFTAAFEARRVAAVHGGYVVAGNRRSGDREGGIWIMRTDAKGEIRNGP